MRSKIIGGSSNSLSQSTTQFAPLVKNDAAWNSAETVQFSVAPLSGTLQNFRVTLSVAPGVGKSRTFTLRKNSVDTGMTVTLSDNQTTASIRSPISIVAGDQLSLSSTVSNSPAQAIVTWCIDFKAGVPNKSMLLGTSSITSTSIGYCPIQGQIAGGVSAPANETLISTNGVLSNLIVVLSAAATTNRTFTIRKNGVDTGVTVSFANGDITKTDAVNTVTVAPGDRIVVALAGSTQAHAGIFIGVVFTATTDGEGVLSCGSASPPSASATNYATIGGVAGNTWDTVEANVQQVTNDVLIKRFDVRLTTAPGSGKSRTFNINVNGAHVGLQVVISDTATTGSAVLDVQVAAGSLLSIESVPSGTPASAGRTEWSLTTFQLNDGGRNQAVVFQ